MILARQHRRGEAERALEEAVSVARAIRHPYAEARVLYEWGSMYASEPEQGRNRLVAAVEIFRRLGARPYSDLAQKAMARTG